MVTMPIAGRLVDRMPIGRIAPFGRARIVIGMFGLTQVTASTPYGQIIPMLFVMGLGMGATMMPLFTSALKTLTSARGGPRLDAARTSPSRCPARCGVALMSVLLTNHLNNSPVMPGTESVRGSPGGITETGAAILSNTRPRCSPTWTSTRRAVPGACRRGRAFAQTYWVAWVLVVLTLVPALLLPRRARGGPPPRRRGRAPGGRRLSRTLRLTCRPRATGGCTRAGPLGGVHADGTVRSQPPEPVHPRTSRDLLGVTTGRTRVHGTSLGLRRRHLTSSGYRAPTSPSQSSSPEPDEAPQRKPTCPSGRTATTPGPGQLVTRCASRSAGLPAGSGPASRSSSTCTPAQAVRSCSRTRRTATSRPRPEPVTGSSAAAGRVASDRQRTAPVAPPHAATARDPRRDEAGGASAPGRRARTAAERRPGRTTGPDRSLPRRRTPRGSARAPAARRTAAPPRTTPAARRARAGGGEGQLPAEVGGVVDTGVHALGRGGECVCAASPARRSAPPELPREPVLQRHPSRPRDVADPPGVPASTSCR